MYIHVIPFSHSIGHEVITYHVPQNLEDQMHVGCLVYVPWGKQEDIALVIGVDISFV